MLDIRKQSDPASGEATVALVGSVTIQEVDAASDQIHQLVEELTREKSVQIHLWDVEEIDTIGLQLLLVIARTLEKTQINYSFTGVREPTQRAIARFSLFDRLNVDHAES